MISQAPETGTYASELRPKTTLRPEKPYPDYPLYAHKTGKWAKKFKGKTYYFGTWADPNGALEEYRAFLARPKSDTVAQTSTSEGMALQTASDLYLRSQEARSKSGEISHRTYMELARTNARLISVFGMERPITKFQPQEFTTFKLRRQETCNIIAVGNEITRVRTFFKWLVSAGYLKSVSYGPDFKKPSRRATRRHKRLQDKNMYTAEQVRWLIEEAGTHLRAMIYLGINCGFGNSDVCTLPKEDVNLKTGWVHYPRPKTEVERNIPLWPETIEALRASQEARRRYTAEPVNPEAFFCTRLGKPWEGGSEPLKRHFKQCLERSGVERGGFYTLRHTFATIADGAKDRIAVQRILGHIDGSMTATYVEEIEEARLRAVVDHVRAWLLG